MTRRTKNSFTLISLVLIAATALCAQEAKPQSFGGTYKLDYVFSEVQDNKRINTRSYTVLVGGTDRGSIRVGDRVPILVGSTKEGGNQIQYLDIGMSIDCRIAPGSESDISLFTNVENSSVAPEQPGENRTGNPVVRQVRYQLNNLVPLNKPTLLGSADEVDGTRRIQIEVTVTKVR